MNSLTTTSATSVVASVSFSALTTTASTGNTTSSVKIAKQRGTSALNSSPLTETTTTINTMNNIIEVIVELSRMQGQAITRAQAEALNTAIEGGYEEWQASKTFNLNKNNDND